MMDCGCIMGQWSAAQTTVVVMQWMMHLLSVVVVVAVVTEFVIPIEIAAVVVVEWAACWHGYSVAVAVYHQNDRPHLHALHSITSLVMFILVHHHQLLL